MGRVLLDTSVLIDVMRARPAAARVAAMEDLGDRPFVCAVSVEELVRGLRPPERDTAGTLIRNLWLAPLGRDEGELAGDWRRELAARGQTLTQADCLIAAAAVGIGARLATGNPKDFPMSGLQVEHWPVGA